MDPGYGGEFGSSVIISVADCFKNLLLVLLEMEFVVIKRLPYLHLLQIMCM